MSLKWEQLQASYNGPRLLFSFVTTSSEYQVYITDLTFIWSEKCDRQAILKRANEQNTTIDASEDAEQFTMLLQRIEEAFHGAQGSSISLNYRSSPESLEIVTLTRLPAPLKPLIWPLYLLKEQQSSVTRYLLLPILRGIAEFQLREQALLEHIRCKDWALGKLVDKIETMGIDLGTVFPSATALRTGQKGTALEHAAKHVKGMAPFDEQSWADEAISSSSQIATNLAVQASALGAVEGLSSAQGKWWRSLPQPGSTPIIPVDGGGEETEKYQQPTPHNGPDYSTDSGQETEDIGFERQETPPRVRQRKSSSTEDQGRGRTRQIPSPQRFQLKGIGSIDRGRQISFPRQPMAHIKITHDSERESERGKEYLSPDPSLANQETATESGHALSCSLQGTTELEERSRPKRARIGVIGGKRNEMPQSLLPKSSERSAVPEATEKNPPVKQTSKLGIIGGKKVDKSPPPSSQPQAPSLRTTKLEDEVFTKRKSKLGVIGGKPTKLGEPAAQGTGRESTPQEPPGLQSEIEKAKSSEHEVEETDQERANCRREELKRQLEAKRRAPAKKRRRF